MDLVLTTQKIKEWLEEMAAGLEPGRFRFCSHGSLVPTQGHGGLMATCFAMRSAWQSGVWELWTEERKNASIEFIRSFQRDDGFFEDPWLMKNAGISLETIINFMLGRVPLKKILHLKKMNLRAETRQCLGDLFNVDSQPPNRVPLEQSSIDTLKNYLNSLPWQQPYTT